VTYKFLAQETILKQNCKNDLKKNKKHFSNNVRKKTEHNYEYKYQSKCLGINPAII